jgi:ubiquinone/menaquinone biosynthesis C-methylase UbiE
MEMQTTDKILPAQKWKLPAWIDSPSITNRNSHAEQNALKSVDDVLLGYVGKDAGGMDHFFDECFSAIKNLCLKGVGVEIGAGVSILSTYVVRNYTEVKNIYAVEVVPKVVDLLQPIILRSNVESWSGTITPVTGSFDEMELEDASQDFCVEYASLHHSDDLLVTITEIARVLKPGGLLFMIDRVHHNRLSDQQRELMLNLEYSQQWLKGNGYDCERLTRRVNGEHEYRHSEWMEVLDKSGVDLVQEVELREVSWKHLFRKIVLKVPFSVRRVLRILPSRVAPHPGEVNWMFCQLIGVVSQYDSQFKRGSSSFNVMLAQKRSLQDLK